MKRIIVSVVIIILAAVFGVLYGLNIPNEGFYSSFDSFGSWLQQNVIGFSNLSIKTGFIAFWSAIVAILLIAGLVISSVIAYKNKKKKQKSSDEVKKDDNHTLVPFKVVEDFNGKQITYTTFVTSSNGMTEEEKDREFVWQNFVDKKHAVRKIIISLTLFFSAIYFIFRFFWIFKDSDGWVGNSFAHGVLNTNFMTWFMISIDSISNFVFKGILPDAADPSKFCVIKNFFNGQNFYVNQLVEFIVAIVAVVLICVIVYFLGALISRLTSKSIAEKRAIKAREEYEDDIKNGREPKYKKQGNTYIINYYYNNDGRKQENDEKDVAPINGSEEVGPKEHEDEESSQNTPKAELIMGGANFTGGDVSTIAEIDQLDDKADKKDLESKTDYIEDISEGVKDVEKEEKPYEEYENVEPKEDDEADIENNDIQTLEGKSEFIFDKEPGDDSLDLSSKDIIDFDEEGFAKVKKQNQENEEVPQVLENERQENKIEDTSNISVVSEPDLALIHDAKGEEDGKIQSIVSLSQYKENEVVVDTHYKLEENIIKSLEKYNPKVSPIASLPDEAAINNGEIFYTKTDDVVVEDAEKKEEPIVVEELPEVEIVKVEEPEEESEDAELEEPKEVPETLKEKPVIPAGLKPVHDIKRREAPKIVPLQIKKTIDDVPANNVPVKVVPTPLVGPVHEITDRSKKKSIKPVEIKKDYRFSLKRFQSSTYKGALTPEEAFALGAIKVTPVVSPVSDKAVNDSQVPSWMKRVKERNAKQVAGSNSKRKQAEELNSIWDVNTKKDVLNKVNDVSLKRKRKPVEPVEVKPVIKKPAAAITKPVAPISIKPKGEEQVNKAENTQSEVQVIKPLAPIHKVNDKPTIKPIKPIKPVTPKK